MARQVGVLIVSLPESCRVHTERRFFNKGKMPSLQLRGHVVAEFEHFRFD
jgi:hypothetical protein